MEKRSIDLRPIPPTRVCVIGAGAIGGFLGVQMARSGVDVRVFARGQTLAARAPGRPGNHRRASDKWCSVVVWCGQIFAGSAADQHGSAWRTRPRGSARSDHRRGRVPVLFQSRARHHPARCGFSAGFRQCRANCRQRTAIAVGDAATSLRAGRPYDGRHPHGSLEQTARQRMLQPRQLTDRFRYRRHDRRSRRTWRLHADDVRVTGAWAEPGYRTGGVARGTYRNDEAPWPRQNVHASGRRGRTSSRTGCHSGRGDRVGRADWRGHAPLPHGSRIGGASSPVAGRGIQHGDAPWQFPLN